MGATTRRGYIDRVLLSFEAAPADETIVWTVGRITTTGTVTGVTPTPVDPLNTGTIVLTAGQNASAEPTYTSGQTVLLLGLNQRSPFLLDLRGIEWPTDLTAAHGYGFKATHGSATPTADIVVEWKE